jgi:hypothetical protein
MKQIQLPPKPKLILHPERDKIMIGFEHHPEIKPLTLKIETALIHADMEQRKTLEQWVVSVNAIIEALDQWVARSQEIQAKNNGQQ